MFPRIPLIKPEAYLERDGFGMSIQEEDSEGRRRGRKPKEKAIITEQDCLKEFYKPISP